MPARLHALYRVRADARSIESRAREIAVEQSVEMPLAAVDDDFVLERIVGQVEEIVEREPGSFEVRIGLAAETVADDAGQLLNMLFGNTSLHEDVLLSDVSFPRELARTFGGPRHGAGELRQRVGAGARALTAAALKPQGLPPERLAQLAACLAQGGIDYVKDDHGLADQAYSPFARRIEAVAAVLGRTASRTRYVPSLAGDLDGMRSQIVAARNCGLDTVMAAPMIMGFSNFHRLVREHPDMAFLAHPTMGGASRIAPPLLIGKLFRLIGADAVVFPNHGGRFGYSPATCRALARAAREDRHELLPSLPVPAGGMSPQRVTEMLDFYGVEVMLLIGGALLQARERLVEATAAFVAEVHNHRYA